MNEYLRIACFTGGALYGFYAMNWLINKYKKNKSK